MQVFVAVGLMSEYGISATWAVVGHLFLASCGSDDGPPHAEIMKAIEHFGAKVIPQL